MYSKDEAVQARLLPILDAELPILNKRGLHARASAKFVTTVERYDAEVHVEKDGLCVSGLSIMGLLMLAASCGSLIKVRVVGKEAPEALRALKELLESRFGETD